MILSHVFPCTSNICILNLFALVAVFAFPLHDIFDVPTFNAGLLVPLPNVAKAKHKGWFQSTPGENLQRLPLVGLACFMGGPGLEQIWNVHRTVWNETASSMTTLLPQHEKKRATSRQQTTYCQPAGSSRHVSTSQLCHSK